MRKLIKLLAALPTCVSAFVGKKTIAAAIILTLLSPLPVMQDITMMPTFVASANAVPMGRSFYIGAKTAQELGDIVACDLDPERGGNTDGTKVINVAKCGKKGDRAYAAPADYLAMLSITDPESGVTSVHQLPGYFRSLINAKAPPGKYGSACMKKGNSGWRPEANCLYRAFKPGEQAWLNPNTHKVVFMQDCSNPVDKPEQPDKCVYIHFYARPDDTVIRIVEAGPTQYNDDCWGLKRAGEADFESPWHDRCPSENCTTAAIESAFNTRTWRKGSYGPNPGLHILRVPKAFAEKDSPFRVFFCIERWTLGERMPYYDIIKNRPQDLTQDEWIEAVKWAEAYNANHSNSIGVRWFDYRDRDGKKVAIIRYDQAELDASGDQTIFGIKSILHWYFSADWQVINKASGLP